MTGLPPLGAFPPFFLPNNLLVTLIVGCLFSTLPDLPFFLVLRSAYALDIRLRNILKLSHRALRPLVIVQTFHWVFLSPLLFLFFHPPRRPPSPAVPPHPIPPFILNQSLKSSFEPFFSDDYHLVERKIRHRTSFLPFPFPK